MKLKDLENKAMINLTLDERKFIADAYLRYFDTLPPRERLLGYFVVSGGVSSLQVGGLDIGFKQNTNQTQNQDNSNSRLEYSLWLDGKQIWLIDNTIESILFDYIQTDDRFMDYIQTDDRFMQYMNNPDYRFPVDDWLKIPVFAPKIHGKTERLHDCRTFLVRAGKAIGFNARRIILHRLCAAPYFKTPFVITPQTLLGVI